MAGILFSTDDSGQDLLVKEEHVQLVMEFLRGCYNSESMRYDKFSASKMAATQFTTEQVEDCLARLLRHATDAGRGEADLQALVAYLRETDEIDRNSMLDATGWPFESVRQFIQLFTTTVKGLKPGPTKKLMKTPLMIAALRSLDKEIPGA
jgi:hypothetical protein